MATMQDAVEIIERRIGFPAAQTRELAARLHELGAIEGTLQIEGLLTIVIALAADLKPETAPELARYLDLTPSGINPAIMPAAVREKLAFGTVEIVLLAYFIGAAEADLESQRALSRLNVEFVSTWPEIVLQHPDGALERFRECGSLATHWGQRGHRRSITISGSALVDTIREIFAGD